MFIVQATDILQSLALHLNNETMVQLSSLLFRLLMMR
jgi:hypothetical protein